MRISDWSSDVCSSDLCCVHVHSSPNPLTLSQARHVPKGLAPLSGDFASSRRPFRATLAARGESMRLSVILPAKNEADGLRQTLPRLREAQPEAELIVVDDGSIDDTAEVAAAHGARVLSSPYSMGNGAAIKRGARAASGEILVFMDADGQHDPACIDAVLAKMDEGYDMVVGARDWAGQAGVHRGAANAFYNWLASRMTGFKVLDLTSGFRAARADKFREFLHLLPNGFSSPTTSTMAFFRSAYTLAYVSIPGRKSVATGKRVAIRLIHGGRRI